MPQLQDHWLLYGTYTRDIYRRMQAALLDFADYAGVEALMDEACRLARLAGYGDANTLLVLGDAKHLSLNLADLGEGEGNCYLSNIWKSSQSLSGVARTQATAYEVRNGLQGVKAAYLMGRAKRLGEQAK